MHGFIYTSAAQIMYFRRKLVTVIWHILVESQDMMSKVKEVLFSPAAITPVQRGSDSAGLRLDYGVNDVAVQQSFQGLFQHLFQGMNIGGRAGGPGGGGSSGKIKTSKRLRDPCFFFPLQRFLNRAKK